MAIRREKIQPQGIHVSMVDGKARYTQVVTVSGTGKMIFVASQLARTRKGFALARAICPADRRSRRAPAAAEP